MFLLNIPTPISVLITILFATIVSISTYYISYPFWARDLSDETKKTAELIAVRAGVMYAIVIGMMFANVRMEHFQMVKTMEQEASALTRLYRTVERQQGSEDTHEVLKNIIEYIDYIVSEQWTNLRNAVDNHEKYDVTGAKSRLEPIWKYTAKKGQETGDQSLQKLFDQIEHQHTMRLYNFRGNLLPLFWYIAVFGYFVTLVPLCTVPPNFRRCVLVSSYGSMVAIVLLGIFILSHPYSRAAGFEPATFKWLLESSSR